MSSMQSQITSLTIAYSTGYSGLDHRKHLSLAFVRGIHRWPVNSPHKGPVTRKMFPFDDVIMLLILCRLFFLSPHCLLPLPFKNTNKRSSRLNGSDKGRHWYIICADTTHKRINEYCNISFSIDECGAIVVLWIFYELSLGTWSSGVFHIFHDNFMNV